MSFLEDLDNAFIVDEVPAPDVVMAPEERSLRDDFTLLDHVKVVLNKVKQDTGRDIGEAVLSLNNHIAHLHQVLDTLPGGDLTRAQQQELYRKECAQFALKREHINKYLALDVLNNPSSEA